ncbi:MAG: dihydropteroate synthase [Ferroplasma sp.]
MEVIFPCREKKDTLEYYINDGKEHKNVSLETDTLKEFYIRNGIFEGYEDYIAEKVKEKIANRKSKIMGILNATPDSFYSASRIINHKIIDSMIEQKPDIIDIGGESTRPGSMAIDPSKEFQRLKEPVEYIKSVSKIPLSIDSRNFDTISKLSKYGIDYINDISGFGDSRMVKLAAETGVKCILMHMVGTPQTMDNFKNYDNIYYEINNYFYERASNMVKNQVKPENIILDPGIGFSKGLNENISIIKYPWSFFLGFDTLFGTSRKSFIGTVTGESVDGRLAGTIATSIYLNQNGVDILRVHDPGQNANAIKMYNYIEEYKP